MTQSVGSVKQPAQGVRRNRSIKWRGKERYGRDRKSRGRNEEAGVRVMEERQGGKAYARGAKLGQGSLPEGGGEAAGGENNKQQRRLNASVGVGSASA